MSLKKLFCGLVAVTFLCSSCGTARANAPDASAAVKEEFRYELGEIGGLSTLMALSWLDAAKAKGAKAVHLKIHSPGGSVFAGLALMQKVEALGIPVHCTVDAAAFSMAFVLLQSCTTRAMTKRSMLMMHTSSANGEMSGGEEDYRNAAEFLRVINRSMVEHCAARMGMDPDKLEAMISGGKELWLDHRQALKLGAVDTVVPSVP